MEIETQNSSGRIIIALIIGLVLGFIAGVFWQSRRAENNTLELKSVLEKNNEAGALEQASSSVKSIQISSEEVPSVFVEKQSSGNAVEITRVVTKWPVWVAVREFKGGADGNILGAAKVGAGTNGAVVELLRPTVSGNSYAVVLYKDVGDPAFNYREDELIKDARGEFIAE